MIPAYGKMPYIEAKVEATMETLRYTSSLRILHWIITVVVFAVWPLGMLLKYFREDVKLDFYLLHEIIRISGALAHAPAAGNEADRRFPSAARHGLDRNAGAHCACSPLHCTHSHANKRVPCNQCLGFSVAMVWCGANLESNW